MTLYILPSLSLTSYYSSIPGSPQYSTMLSCLRIVTNVCYYLSVYKIIDSLSVCLLISFTPYHTPSFRDPYQIHTLLVVFNSTPSLSCIPTYLLYYLPIPIYPLYPSLLFSYRWYPTIDLPKHEVTTCRIYVLTCTIGQQSKNGCIIQDVPIAYYIYHRFIYGRIPQYKVLQSYLPLFKDPTSTYLPIIPPIPQTMVPY